MKLNYKELRKRLEITQADLVDALGVNQPTISALETGRKDTSARHIELLRAKYGDIVLQYIEDSTPQNVVYTGNVSGSGNNIVAGNGNNIGTADDDSAVIPEPVIVPASIMQRPELDTKKMGREPRGATKRRPSSDHGDSPKHGYGVARGGRGNASHALSRRVSADPRNG